MQQRMKISRLRQNNLNDVERRDFLEMVARVRSWPIYIRDGVLSVSDIEADADRYIGEHGIQVVGVDYIQKIMSTSGKISEQNREREVAAVSSALKNIAMTYRIPVIALSQLNEDMQTRESRSIAQDLDVLLTIQRTRKEVCEVIDGHDVVKVDIRQRFGVSGEGVELWFNREHGYWTDAGRNVTERMEPDGDERKKRKPPERVPVLPYKDEDSESPF
jgi:replicative DNA helicase